MLDAQFQHDLLFGVAGKRTGDGASAESVECSAMTPGKQENPAK
jgi:hypothetical protein